MIPSKSESSGIWDNHQRGSIGDFLKEKIHHGSDLSFVSVDLEFIHWLFIKSGKVDG
jgi:hypothetical protein